MKLTTWISCGLIGAAAACGSTTPKTGTGSGTAAPDPQPATGAWARATLLAGDWRAAGWATELSWLRPGRPDGAAFGVILESAQVWVVDDEAPPPGTGDAENEPRLRLTQYRLAEPLVTCDEDRSEPEGLWFGCDDGSRVRFWQNGDMLDYDRWTATDGPITLHNSPLGPEEVVAAPELEDADRAYDAETAKRGAPGWASFYADDGVVWTETPAIGPAAIEADIAPFLASHELRWVPTVSRLYTDGTVGVTAGTWTATPRAGGAPITGTYVTLWRKTGDRWRITFDVGRSDPAPQ